MSSIAQTARLGRTRRRGGARARPRLLLGGGLLWIVVFATLLAGVVAINVAVLRLNLQLDRVGRDRSQFKADIARLQSQVSSAAATAEIERIARDDLGLVKADPGTEIFVRLPAR